EPAGPARSRWHFRFRRKRLLVGKYEIESSAGRHGPGPGHRRHGHPRKLRAIDERGRRRTVYRRVAPDQEAREQGRGMIYLDYQATTPVPPDVARAMRPWIEEKFATPPSPSG